MLAAAKIYPGECFFAQAIERHAGLHEPENHTDFCLNLDLGGAGYFRTQTGLLFSRL